MKGLYGKYKIEKADGTPIDKKAKYFVLRYDKDPHAKKAMEVYAESVRQDNPWLALEIEQQLHKKQ